MPNLPISLLPQSTTLQGDELFVDVQGGVTKYTTLNSLSAFTTSSIQLEVNNLTAATSSYLTAHQDTGSLMVTGSLSGSSLVFEKGDTATFDIDLSSTFITPSQTGSFVNTSYGLFNQTGSYTGVSASLDETSLIGGGVGTLSVPVNGFRQGDAYQATFSGTCLFHNGDTLRLRVKASGILLADTGIITLTRADAERWNLTIDFSIHQIGAAGVASLVSTGIFQYTQHASSILSGKNFGFVNNSTFDTTISNELEVTGQFDHNDNVISTDIFTLRKIF